MRRVLLTLALMAGAFVAMPAAAANAAPVYYRIVNAQSDQCLNQDYSGGVPHADVLAWNCGSNSNTNELWQIIDITGTNRAEIVNKATGKCLNQDFSGNVEHAQVIVYTCSTGYYNGLWDEQWDQSNGEAFFANDLTGKFLNQDYSGGVAHHDVLAYYSLYLPPPLNSEWVVVPA